MDSLAENIQPTQEKEEEKKSSPSAIGRVLKYSVVRLISLFVTVVIGVYLTIMIANMGGYVDDMMKSEIQERITIEIGRNPAFNMDPATKNELIQRKLKTKLNAWVSISLWL